ncbi:MAG: hypothetical protein ACR2PZ_03090 [Pseudomonadales bacterium]
MSSAGKSKYSRRAKISFPHRAEAVRDLVTTRLRMDHRNRITRVLVFAVIAIGFTWNERIERFHQQQAVFDPWSHEH